MNLESLKILPLRPKCTEVILILSCDDFLCAAFEVIVLRYAQTPSSILTFKEIGLKYIYIW